MWSRCCPRARARWAGLAPRESAPAALEAWTRPSAPGAAAEADAPRAAASCGTHRQRSPAARPGVTRRFWPPGGMSSLVTPSVARQARAASTRPVRREVVTDPRDLPQALAVAADREYLHLAGPRRRECDVAAARGVARALVAALAEGDLPNPARRELVGLDVVARARLAHERQLVEWVWRPRRAIAVRVRGDLVEVQPVGPHDVHGRAPGPVGGERDLGARRRPARRRVDGRVVRQATHARAIAVHDVQLRVAVAARREHDLRAVGRPAREPVLRARS